MDVTWLQRDLGLYLVGLFDTYWACRALEYPGKSLAYLLGKFVDFEADKKYQLADWRIRYARPFLYRMHMLTTFQASSRRDVLLCPV